MNIRKADNMNKKSFFLLLALLTLNLTACSDSAEETQQITTAAPNNYTAVSTDTTVSGEVTAIAGNYVTLALGTVEENKDDSDNSNSDDKSDGNYDMPSDLPDAPNNDGNGTPRQILSGIHKFYEPETLVGKTVVAILNLPPRKMMGQMSNGMLLSAVREVEGKEELHLVILDDSVPAGSQLC